MPTGFAARRADSGARTNLVLASDFRVRSGIAAQLLVPLAACAGLAALVPGENPLDHALPLLAFLLACLGWVEHRSGAGALLVPYGAAALMFARLLIAEDHLRFLCYGGVFLLAFLRAVWPSFREGRIRTTDAAILVAILAVLTRALPWDPEVLLSIVVLVASAVGLCAAASRKGFLHTSSLLWIFAVLMAAPLAGNRTALFPLLAAAALLWLRGPSLFSFAFLVVVSLLAGKWGIPVLLAAVVSALWGERSVLRRGRVEAGAIVPVLSGIRVSFGALLRGFSFDPAAAAELSGTSSAFGCFALLLWAAALLVRQPVGLLYVVLGLSLLVLGSTAERGRLLLLPPLFFSFCFILLFPWSGAVTATFPLPVAIAAMAGLAAILLLPAIAGAGSLLRTVPVSLVAAAALGVMVISELPAAHWQSVGSLRVIRRGESVAMVVPGRTDEVRVVLSGGNIASLPAGVELGWLEVVDRQGMAFRTPLRVGDFADWGAGRRQHHFTSRGVSSRHPAGRIDGFVREAFLSGAGEIRVRKKDISAVQVTGGEALGARGRLNVESVEARRE